MRRPAELVVAFYNHRGTAEQHIKEGKNTVTWTRLSCRHFAANSLRLQLHAPASNLADFPRTLAPPEAVNQWSLTALRDQLMKIGARIMRHVRSITFQIAEVPVERGLFQKIPPSVLGDNYPERSASVRCSYGLGISERPISNFLLPCHEVADLIMDITTNRIRCWTG
jgi:hypothetical protein